MIGLLLLAVPALAGLVTGGAEGLDEAWRPRRVAVVVGVQDYADPALQGLRFPAKDARDLGAVLADPDVGGFDRVVVVDGGPATTRAGSEATRRSRSATANPVSAGSSRRPSAGRNHRRLPAAGSRVRVPWPLR